MDGLSARAEIDVRCCRSYARVDLISSHQFEEEIGAASSENGLFITKMEFSIWTDFEGEVLAKAIKATFAKRRTPLPTAAPIALTTEFAGEQVKQNQWRAFVRRGRLRAGDVPLEEIVTVLHGFLMPVVEALNAGSPFSQRWKAEGPWGR